MIQCQYFSTIAPLHAAESVADANNDGLPISLQLLTKRDYAIRIVTSRLSFCMAPKE